MLACVFIFITQLHHTIFSSLSSIARTALIIPFSFSKTFFSLKSREKNKKIRYIYHKELS